MGFLGLLKNAAKGAIKEKMGMDPSKNAGTAEKMGRNVGKLMGGGGSAGGGSPSTSIMASGMGILSQQMAGLQEDGGFYGHMDPKKAGKKVEIIGRGD